ncbi:S41 family peptidase [Reichenbachiella sp.]|uniref:S41 family peptidase n=1 Tax=Reichenbachiella sp. TaxID=2184521 RepID=UPI003BB1ACEF
MKLIVFLIGFFSALSLSAQHPGSYEEDFQLYKKALLETHPSLYRFTTKDQFHDVLDSIEKSIDTETNEWEFFRALTGVHAMIRESHSYLGASKDLMIQARSAELFPLRIWLAKGRILVTGSREEAYDYLIGKEIESINGQSVESIISSLETFSLLNSGNNNSAMYKELSGFDNFSFAYYFNISQANQFEIVYQDGEESRSILLHGSDDDLADNFPKFPSEPIPPYTFVIDKEADAARLTITTFAYWVVDKSINDYKVFLKNFFSSIEENNIRNLVIDVSENRGGEEMIGAELLTYLIDHPFEIYNQVSTKTLDYSFTNSLPNSSKLKFPKKNFTYADSCFVLQKGEVLKRYVPKQEHKFTGNVYFISSGRSRSATNILLALAKTHQVGTIVGQESGGTFRDLDGRWRATFNLPFSKVLVSYPVWRFKINSKGQDPQRGVIPDLPVDRSVEDILSGKKPELEFVYQLIRNAQ